MSATLCKARAHRLLKQILGPTVRLQSIDKAGLRGVRVVDRRGVFFQTYDLRGDVWRRAVLATVPYARILRRREAAARA